jgi:quinol monooxygenase YgiN
VFFRQIDGPTLIGSTEVKVVIINTTRITVRPENRTELFQTILPLLNPLRNEKGCLDYRFYVDAVDENSSLLIGQWRTREDWANHLKSADFAVLLGAITILSSPGNVAFSLLSAVEDDGFQTQESDWLEINQDNSEKFPRAC